MTMEGDAVEVVGPKKRWVTASQPESGVFVCPVCKLRVSHSWVTGHLMTHQYDQGANRVYGLHLQVRVLLEDVDG